MLVVSWGTNVSTPFLVPYRERLGLSDAMTQLIFVIYVIGILVALFLAGQASDRFGRRRIMIPSMVLGAVASLILIFGRDSLPLLLAGRILLGVVVGATLGTGAAWMQELMGRGQEVRAAVITTFVVYFGFGVGPPLSAMFDLWLPHPLVLPFLLHVGVTLFVVPLVMTVPETVDLNVPERSGRWQPEVQFGVPADAKTTFWWSIVPAAIWVFAFPSVGFSLLPVVVSDAIDGNVVLVAGITGAATAWGGLTSRPVLKRVTPSVAIGLGIAIGALGYGLGAIAVAADLWPLVWPAAFVLGASSGVLSTACLATVGEISDEENRGALSSTFYLIAYMGMTMPLIIIGLASFFGLVATLVGLAVIGGAAAATTPWRHRRLAHVVQP